MLLALALLITSSTASSSSSGTASQKAQWAPTGPCAPLHACAVSSSETSAAARPYAGERPASVVGRKDYAYAHENPLRYTDSSGHVANVIVGAALGAAIGFGVSVLTQAMGNEDFSWKKAGAAAAGGAISGAVAGATMGGSLLLEAGGAVASGMVGGATTRALMGEKTTAKDLLIDGAIAGVTFGVVKGVTSASANGQMTAAIKELQKETAANVAAKAAPVVVQEAAEQAGTVTTVAEQVPQNSATTEALTPQTGSARPLDPRRAGFFADEKVPVYENSSPNNLLGQELPDSCVGACARMRLADRGDQRSEAVVRQWLGVPDRGGIAIENVAEPLSSKFGLEVESSKLSFEDLARRTEPSIVAVRGHALIVDEVKKGMVSIRDPLPLGQGSTYRLLSEDFKRFFETGGEKGRALLFGPPK